MEYSLEINFYYQWEGIVIMVMLFWLVLADEVDIGPLLLLATKLLDFFSLLRVFNLVIRMETHVHMGSLFVVSVMFNLWN
jgi:hypothetical protein